MLNGRCSFEGLESISPKSDYSIRSSIPLNLENVEQLRDKWAKYIAGLEKTPIEIQLATNRAEQALHLANIQNAPVQRKSCRPITALYASPRTTKRMRRVLETHMPESQSFHGNPSQDKLYCHLCPQCGFVKDSTTPEQFGERMRQRLKRFLAKNPSLRKVVNP
ncbi:uncharacterized protein Dwil_GK19352 [Drosophila willistoni]|uniref:Uncharacterized protein n=1 Tax=Drosophila willistoni TaxID=7260 RepID=B4N158_DROWI|nr:uncharacterized protein Dwil_GK19352 [Drosophila willistoni]